MNPVSQVLLIAAIKADKRLQMRVALNEYRRRTNCGRADKRLQMRVALNDEHVDDIAEALAEGKELDGPLPVIFQCGSDCWLADGFHRLAAHIKAGRSNMRCEVRPGTYRDALRYSLGANQHTSLKRTNADKRKAVETALGDEILRQFSDRQIAELCGVGNVFVSSVRQRLLTVHDEQSNELTVHDEQSNELTVHGEQSTQRLGRDGRTIDTVNIGKSPRKAALADVPDTADELSDDLSDWTDLDYPEEEEEKMTDPFGRPLRFGLIQVFKHRTAILSMIAELEDEKGRITDLRIHAGGSYIPPRVIEDHLNIAKQLLEAAVPQAVCPDCGAGDKQAICHTCDGEGYLSVGKFAKLPLKLQEKAKAF